ncbi:hypothetical protein [Sphingomonas adhaesiva]|uniref:hypothetical protein n=1 Tax=Sphingomonas adhaesiva TaxID=28212 RepID=UPI002FFC7575
MTQPPPDTAPRRRLVLAVLGGWLFAAVVLLVLSAGAIARPFYADPDDAMRILEVRDWLAGQSWFDVAQHRLNGGAFAMHWSRLVDLPLAATMLLLRPVLGAAQAEVAAAVIVPLLTLLAIMALVASITRRLGGLVPAQLAVVIVGFAAPLLGQARPLRVDHHAWQIVLALVAVRALLGAPTARSGATIGLALAALLTVSLEGLPIAAAIAGVATLAWAWRGDGRDAPAMAWTLFLASALLQAATRGPAMWASACDAMAPAWIASLGGAAMGVTIAVAVSRFGRIARFGGVALGGALAAGVVLVLSPACLAGPFATLPPRVFRLWYMMVLEGRPLWEQGWSRAAMTVGLPVMGLIGTLRARALAATGERRTQWTMLLAIQAAALAIAIMVNRAGATANALAVPGAAILLCDLLRRARQVEATGPRILATVGAFLLISPGQLAALPLIASDDAADALDLPRHRRACRDTGDIASLATLPKATLFAPLDMTPALLVSTPHHAVASGYHRNAAAMDRVIHALTAPPDEARALVTATRADYLVACPGLSDVDLYRAVAPQGLWARLERGERIDWLRPVRLAGPVLVWRVIRPVAAAPLRESPARR